MPSLRSWALLSDLKSALSTLFGCQACSSNTRFALSTSSSKGQNCTFCTSLAPHEWCRPPTPDQNWTCLGLTGGSDGGVELCFGPCVKEGAGALFSARSVPLPNECGVRVLDFLGTGCPAASQAGSQLGPICVWGEETGGQRKPAGAGLFTTRVWCPDGCLWTWRSGGVTFNSAQT